MNLNLKTFVAGATDAKGHFAVEIPAGTGLKLYVALKGEIWVKVEGTEKKFHLRQGDSILLSGGKRFVMSTRHVSIRTVKLADILKFRKNGTIKIHGGGETTVAALEFSFDGDFQKLIFDCLPHAIHIQNSNHEASVIQWSVDKFRTEFLGDEVGRSVFLNHLAPLILLQILRFELKRLKKSIGWLASLSEPKIGLALKAMHSQFERDWKIESLAKVAGMSRAAFALRFKKQIGISPMEYLTQWRMQMACNMLRFGENTIAEIAEHVGYGSESAFSLAFKRVMKCRPGSYQRSYQKLY